MPTESDFQGLLEWRCIGPFRGGRVVTVAGDYNDPNVFYFGACAGGIWKTYDGGTYWECVSDGFLNTASVGALAVAPSDSNVIYAGMGESTIRIDVSHGDGVYKSTDAGRTWKHLGLEDTRHIGKVRVHPTNPDIVYVAALGHAFGPNKTRGVYKSTDGGATWKQVLFKSEKAGAVDLSIDTANPRILYTTIWEAHRSFWMISSGGPESGLWQSTDGGDTWADISDRPGLPKGIKGKMAVVASPARSGRVWVLIEHAKEGGLYRSDDAGANWEKVSDNQNLISRAWYYVHLTADPVDPDTIYVNNLAFWKSTDGGKTFVEIDTPHGDNHDLWIDPRNNQRMIQGNDGGANVSFNGGATWSSIYNQPTAQFYHLAVDTRSPYYVYGTQQDNTSIAVPSRSWHSSITWGDCYVAGTGESGYIAVRPDNPDIVYVGAIGSSPGGGNALQRYDHRTRQIRLITTWPEVASGVGAGEHKYRFAWTYPIIISPHDPNVLYIGGNQVFKSTNEGQSWEAISPDLTRADPETLKPTGGPVNLDAIGAETYATVFSLVESPHEQGVLWAGSDDGLVHLSKDGGKSWKKITPKKLPEWSMISMIEVSPHDPATAYLVATRYKLDDPRPYIYKTTDYGKNWKKITDGIPDDDFTRALREDPNKPGLLYAGTETGLYISFDAGENWERFQLNLPVAPIHDLLLKDNDLIVATHGRSFWVLDDVTPLHQISDGVTKAKAHLFKPRTTTRVTPLFDWSGGAQGKNYGSSPGIVSPYTIKKTPENRTVRTYIDAGTNPPLGAIITYHLKQKPAGSISLAFSDAQGNQIRRFTSLPPAEAAKPAEPAEETAQAVPPTEDSPLPEATTDESKKELRITANAGWNRFIWDLRYAELPKIEGKDPASEMTINGPLVAPGTYQVTLTVGDQSWSETFAVVKNPSVEASEAELEEQRDLLLAIHSKTEETIKTINRMRDLRRQLDDWSKRAPSLSGGAAIGASAQALKAKILEIEKTLLVPDMRSGWADAINNGSRLFDKLIALPGAVSLGDYRPTDQAQAVFADLSGRIDAQSAKLNELIETELAALNQAIATAGIGALVPKA